MWQVTHQLLIAPCPVTTQFIANHPARECSDAVMLPMAQYLKHTPYVIHAYYNNVLQGVLQVMHLRNRVFAPALIAGAFATAHGALWHSNDAAAQLLQGLCGLAQHLKAPYVVVRLREALPEACVASLNISHHVDTLYHNFSGALVTDINTLPRKARADVRAAFAHQDLCYSDNDFDAFFYCYRRSMRDLGTPMHKKAFYQLLAQHIPHTVAVVSHKGQPLCGTLAWHDAARQAIYPYYGGGIPEARVHNAFDRMYFELMQRAAQQGYTSIDFGRSKIGTGAFDYKKRRGFVPQPLYYLNLHCNGQVPQAVNPLNPKFARAIAIWQKMPLWLADAIGGYVAREIT